MRMQRNSDSWKNGEGSKKKCGNVSTTQAKAALVAAADAGKRYLQVEKHTFQTSALPLTYDA